MIDAFKRDGPTADELKRVKANQQTGFVNGLQTNLGKAFQLAQDQVFFNNPSHTLSVSYPRTQAVTAVDVKWVANNYLTDKRVVLSTVPMGKADIASHADKSTVVTDPFAETTGAKP